MAIRCRSSRHARLSPEYAHALHGSVGWRVVSVLVTIRRRPASRLYAANDGPVQRLRSGDAVNKSVIRGQPSSLKPREGNARTRERGGTLDPSDAQARRRAPRYRATALRRAPRAVRQRRSGWTLVGRRLPRCAPGDTGNAAQRARRPAVRLPPRPPLRRPRGVAGPSPRRPCTIAY